VVDTGSLTQPNRRYARPVIADPIAPYGAWARCWTHFLVGFADFTEVGRVPADRRVGFDGDTLVPFDARP